MRDPEPEPVELPIDGTLDLHTFAPADIPSVVADYLDACWERGIVDVKLIHGKGKGVQRRRVHGVLDRHPRVCGYGLDPGPSGWGATWVELGNVHE